MFSTGTDDRDAFEALFRALHAPLCEVVDSYVRSQDVAEEIVQELFFVVWMKRKQLKANSLHAYLFASARNRALNHLRHRSVASRWSRLVDARPDVAGVAPPGPRPDDVLEQDERHVALRRAIDDLPPRARLALVLQTDHGMSNGEIATAMGISIKGVEKLLFTARAKLRASLGAHADD